MLSLPVYSRCIQGHRFGTGFGMSRCQCLWALYHQEKTMVVENSAVHILELLLSWFPSLNGLVFTRIPLDRKYLGGKKHCHFTVVLIVSRTVPGIE